MTSLMRWDPFRDFMTLRNAMDRLFEEAFAAPTRWALPSQGWGLALDLIEEENEFVVKAAVPGMRPEDLDVSLSADVLTIRGETKAEQETKEERYHIRERHFGSFTRSVRLPAPVDADNVAATYENGVLTVRIPKAEQVRPRKIAVQTPKVIEAQASTTKEGEHNSHRVEAAKVA